MNPLPLANLFKRSNYDEPKSSELSALDYLNEVFLEIYEFENLKGKEKRTLMKKILKECPFTERLYKDVDNPTHLQRLYKSVETGNPWYFYMYVRIGDMKRRVLR